jgi:hypothetical protein
MPAQDSQLNDSPDAIIEELTAYLDGELDEQTQLSVESRLGSDAKYLAELQSLQRTWETLDHLPQADADKSFTQTTMEMIVTEAKSESTLTEKIWPWIAKSLALALVAGGLFAGGYLYQRSNQSMPDQVLLANLPTIEKHEIYQAINSDLSFLEQLNHPDLFPPLNFDPIKSTENKEAQDQADEATDPLASLESRRIWLDSLDVEKKSALKEKLDDFLALEQSQQDVLLDFEAKLTAHPDRQQLLFVLNDYYRWLKSLDPAERSRLQDEPPANRVISIAKLRDEKRSHQAIEKFKLISSSLTDKDDADLIFYWFVDLIKDREDIIRSRFPITHNATREANGLKQLPVEKLRQHADRRELNWVASYIMEYDRPFVEAEIIDKEQLAYLANILSNEARSLLFNMPEQAQEEVMFEWIKSVNDAYRRTFKFNYSDDQLKKFARSLPAQVRDELDQLPLKAYVPKLMELYRQKNSSLPVDR